MEWKIGWKVNGMEDSRHEKGWTVEIPPWWIVQLFLEYQGRVFLGRGEAELRGDDDHIFVHVYWSYNE